MSKGIRMHPEHGLNPTITHCFWCGESKDEIALLGAAYRAEAPMTMVLDYEPCKKCGEAFARGILVIECNSSTDRKFTGRHMVIKPGAVEVLIPNGELVASIREHGKMLVGKEIFDALLANLEASDSRAISTEQ